MKGTLVVVEVIGLFGLILVLTCCSGGARATVKIDILGGGSVYLRAAVYERGYMENLMVYIYIYIIRVWVRVIEISWTWLQVCHVSLLLLI